MKKVISALLVSVFAAGTAFAATSTEVDADTDGKVTMEEAKAKMPDLSEDAFKEADADNDGSLILEKFEKLES